MNEEETKSRSLESGVGSMVELMGMYQGVLNSYGYREFGVGDGMG